jgi:hypothetical protein
MGPSNLNDHKSNHKMTSNLSTQLEVQGGVIKYIDVIKVLVIIILIGIILSIVHFKLSRAF